MAGNVLNNVRFWRVFEFKHTTGWPKVRCVDGNASTAMLQGKARFVHNGMDTQRVGIIFCFHGPRHNFQRVKRSEIVRNARTSTAYSEVRDSNELSFTGSLGPHFTESDPDLTCQTCC